MVISVVGRHVDLEDELKSYAEEKAGKLVRFYDRIQAIEIIFQEEKETR